jgi:hypothetical protein
MKHRSTVSQNRNPNSELALMSSGRRGLWSLLQNCKVGFQRPSVKTNRGSSPVHFIRTSMIKENRKSNAKSSTTKTSRRYRALNQRQAWLAVHPGNHFWPGVCSFLLFFLTSKRARESAAASRIRLYLASSQNHVCLVWSCRRRRHFEGRGASRNYRRIPPSLARPFTPQRLSKRHTLIRVD